MKKIRAPRKPETHFEQIPLEVVKEIAQRDDADREKAGTDNVSVQRPLKSVRPVLPTNSRTD
jgi:hypothetical protein